MARHGTHRGKPLLSNHQKSWLWGTVPVFETLHARCWPVYELVMANSGESEWHQRIRALAESQQIPLRRESATRLTELCKASDHQGILALLGPFPYAPLAPLLPGANAASVILLLDRLQDAHNFGAIVRSAAAFGTRAVIIGEAEQVPVNSHVARSSAGAVNHVPICRARNLASTLKDCRAAGFRILAATMQGNLSIRNVRLADRYAKAPLVLLIGNEATGIAPELIALCDDTLSIPMTGPVESLNAAVAAGILLFELILGREAISE